MSLLINGMDMPKNGRVTIDLASEETGTNIIARITDDKTGKLIEHKGVVVIPTPHGDLIDRGELINQSIRFWDDATETYDEIIGVFEVKNAKAIIEAEE